MTSTLDALRHFAARAPERAAVRTADRQWRYRELHEAARSFAHTLAAHGIRVAGLAADNGFEWLALDLAAQLAGVVLVPLPSFFTREQLAHALTDSGADALIADPRLLALLELADAEIVKPLYGGLTLYRLRGDAAVELPAATAKISYTSGTTGQPKGVCLRQSSMDAVADSLRTAVAELQIRRHLCVLPLATLLENIAGLYAPLLNGAELVVPSVRETGFAGAAQFDPAMLLRSIDTYRPQSIILVPQLLAALVAALEQDAPLPQSLRFVAVGGGRVSPALLARADRLGLPVYEGYGLTECASVVALNTPAARRIGSVGRPLPHAELAVDARGEIHVAGPSVCGYVGGEGVPPRIATGDLGRIDADGFLYVDGRCKNLFITSFGRNVSPEWVEAELAEQAPIAQAAVFGEARPWNVAVVVAPNARPADVAAAIDRANRGLPDYARIGDWLTTDEPFAARNGLLTANGRNRRSAIWSRYRSALDALYDERLDRTA
jgi:long-subunit acyl-CoA synthetase (AMP-forming)